MKKGSFLPKIKNILRQHLMLISVVLGMFIALGLKLEFVKDTNFLGFTARANDMVYLIFTIGICLLMYYAAKIKDKRLWITSIIVGIIFSICYYFGDIQNNYMYTYVPTSKKFILYSIIKLMAYFILFTNCTVMLFNKLPILASKFNSKKECKFFTNNKKSFWLVAIIFFVSYIPFFLHYFPGNVNTDSVGSLYQITGISPYTNFQPIVYTLILGGLWNLGKAIFGTSVAGIALYSIFQMICTSLVFSMIMYYMAKRKCDIKWRVVTFLFLILNPLNGWFVVRCEKGILFHLSLILVIIGIIDIIHEQEKFFEKKWKPILLGLVSIIMMFIRNNGIYALVLALPFLIWGCKKARKQSTILFGVTIATVLIIQGPIFKMLNITYSNPGEALSVPIQQFARITKYDNGRLTEEDKGTMQRYFDKDLNILAQEYLPWKSDSVKLHFSAEEFQKDKMSFIREYFKLAVKYPVQTVSSIVLNTGNNYSPNFNVWGIIRDYGTETQDAYGTLGSSNDEGFKKFINAYPIEAEPIIEFDILNSINDELVKGNIPVISNLFGNIGFYFWILVFCFAYCIYKKQYKNIIMMLPILGLWVTTIAAPIVDLRYVYPMFLTAPIFIGIIIRDIKIKEENG